MPTLLFNHLGYQPNAPKTLVINASAGQSLTVEIINAGTSDIVLTTTAEEKGPVDQWKDFHYYVADFSGLTTEGDYQIHVPQLGLVSDRFPVAHNLYHKRLLGPILDYYGQNRCADEQDEWDKQAPFVGDRDERVDVHGGWYDASGDWSKYLSHLSFANFMNPQQIPLVTWSLFEAYDRSQGHERQADTLAEALFGTDFLVRMQDPAGYFYMTVFDKWSKDKTQREICAYETQQGHKYDTYQAGYRQGGGMAIAALAKAARYGDGEFTRDQYLTTAIKGFEHLEANNLSYLDNGEENIIDDYCALMAAIELYRTTSEAVYRKAASKRTQQLLARLSSDENFDGWLASDNAGERPYSHASDEGLPVVALLNYYQFVAQTDELAPLQHAIERHLGYWHSIAYKVNNPFDYPRHYCRPVNSEKTDKFFFPHENESGYWWQGENARLGSMASAWLLAAETLPSSEENKTQWRQLAFRQTDWILGRNPYDACMLQGYGRNNPFYLKDWPGHTGGICNGITSSLYNENDIGLEETEDMLQNWRWGEQWIPHAAWFLYAISLEASL
ncbi:glycoside hydrolase family 9 protein [Salinibius halmophilus]|uniref:glycoside hydrolase family 9 protein n=1 Tax=Salinibius halmophilus TaxID=1853216 RepID=UPI000E672BF0|nr:glycoside hydrolase family 9 protein [Salinibius halmophilus]